MGAPSDPAHNFGYQQTPEHTVTLTRGFYLARTEVTQGQWQRVMGTTIQTQRDLVARNARLSAVGPDVPMFFVNWNDADQFCRKLGPGFRLPTEAEWEYACRGGLPQKECDAPAAILSRGWVPDNSGKAPLDSEKIISEAWKLHPGDATKANGFYDEKIAKNRCQVHPVAGKKANPYGLFDMQGNLWEWCQDWYANIEAKDATDPTGPTTGKARVNRGGSFQEAAFTATSIQRMCDEPEGRGDNLGFRVAFVPAP